MVELIVPSVMSQRVSPRTGNQFFVVNRFLILFKKLIDVFVQSSADHNPGLRSILHGINFHFNSMLIQVIRNLDFQYWANFRVSLISSFRGGSFITSRHDPACQNPVKINATDFHIFASFTHYSLEYPLEDFRIFCYDFATSLPVPEH